MSDPVELDRFVRAVHRRWVVVRAVERMGLCLLAGCVAALLLTAARWTQGRSGLPPAQVALVLSAAVGLLWGFSQRPTLIRTAAEADRQLALADLLGTAWALRRSNRDDPAEPDPWRQTVLAIAEARCRRLSASAVVLHRWGVRAWGGVGLAVALVFTVGLLGSNPATSRAGAGGLDLASDSVDSPVPRPAPFGPPSLSFSARPAGGESLQPQSSDASQFPTDSDSMRRAPSDRSSPTGGAAGGGIAAGQTTGSAPQGPALSPSPNPGSPAGGVAATGGNGSGGAQAGSSIAGIAAGRSTGFIPAGAGAAPPWSSSSWPADRAAAFQQLDAGQVPDAYRDLVREYFQRP